MKTEPETVEEPVAEVAEVSVEAVVAEAEPPAEPQSDKVAKKALKAAAAKEALLNPTEVTLAAPYGFIDADDVPKHWPAGMTVTDPDDIKTLIDRGALIVGHPDAAPNPSDA